ncbi:thioesterase domain-containing protein [Paractinoplanes rishiriensis]|uniref:Thioesterase TesA-like domain-containing protein n=1 Tax=Paractinoplanes rishiriensis TaxID=1050105 RepID=A0A919K2I2_9ACTN|nr:thioesterase domain-containing protein [Actinoplanes rishiriensis]GIE97677.1 hypothetical protein Ari01nite_51420 [Actinoplanes rishiriensis]
MEDAQWQALAARLRPRGRGPAEPGPVVPLGRTGPVAAFALPTMGGTVHEYAALAGRLDGACRVWGIEADGPLTSLPVMVERAAGLVRSTQPEGPYRLLGWAAGGVLAYETARLLEADGAEVALVVLVDAPSRTGRWRPDPADDLAAMFAGDVLRGLGRPAGTVAGLSAAQQLSLLADRLHPDRAGDLRAALERWYAVFVAHGAALAGYRAEGLLGAAAVLVSAHGSQDWAPYWRARFRGPVREISTTAGHYGCLHAPAVGAVAAAIRGFLR